MGNPSSPKLKGDYVWPFTLTLPEKVKAPTVPGGPLEDYRLPPNFSERAAPCYLEYKIRVKLRRGKLRIDNVLFASFAYLPRIRPVPSSELRQLAYREESRAPGPDIDINGWCNLGTSSITGTIFESRPVTASCTFYLTEPLSYTRGTSIPFYIQLQSSDRQALDLFSSRGSLTIALARTLYMQSAATSVEDSRSSANKTNKVFTSVVGQAIYWPTDDNDLNSATRTLEGEIPIRVDLKPSFVFPNISIKYHVSFFISAPGFTATAEGSEPVNLPLFNHEVEIASILPTGPVPRSRIPAAELKKNEGNYDVSIGMLTAANQRFIHYMHRPN
ncbi:hypothetical protein M422DRAFT_258566 [Sphaerobolus stellatus SS14]|uniref:Arrestin-like N-terminal domain-containing protein n=1 Tax=Sphaerobolus stellatus (strain SS14) TaxID=990650 RepID=A0A0C9VM04_SPHS4|nr:hypothetical protein M422DRAFT_258566 [Sphaerobolus stellatus SS14]